jgi:hypothetical protein
MTEEPVPVAQRNQRASDRGILCWIAMRLADFWDFVDKRQVDVHLVCWAFFALTGYVVYWTTEYVWAHPDKPGLEIAAIVGAVTVPLTWIMPKIIDSYLKARA